MYRKGQRIPTIHELVFVLERGEYVFWGDRPNHPAWMRSMSFNNLAGGIKRGWFHYAIRNEEAA
jgi:hypothetical protein